jgi:uncharacterized protein YjiS (DUF1127 family)
MTAIDCCETEKTATGWTAVAGAAVAAVEKAGNLFRAFANRRELYRLGGMSDRELYRLGGMSDRELHDIGLTRSDLFVARNVHASVDPTARLGALADVNCDRLATRPRR